MVLGSINNFFLLASQINSFEKSLALMNCNLTKVNISDYTYSFAEIPVVYALVF